MDTIWKFTFYDLICTDADGGYFDLQLAEDAIPLSVQVQRGEPMLWVRTTDEAILPEYPTPNRRFYICGTGHKLHPRAGKHLGTFQLDNGRFVFHVFEEKQDD